MVRPSIFMIVAFPYLIYDFDQVLPLRVTAFVINGVPLVPVAVVRCRVDSKDINDRRSRQQRTRTKRVIQKVVHLQENAQEDAVTQLSI